MRLNVDIKKRVYDEFAEHCGRDGRSLSEVTRSLITDWNAKKRREELQLMQIADVKKKQETEEMQDDKFKFEAS